MLPTLAELEKLVIAYFDGAPVQLRDVARVEDGSEDLRTEAHYNGEVAVGLGIQKQSGGNTVAIVDEVKRRIADIRTILPSGITIDEDVCRYYQLLYAMRSAAFWISRPLPSKAARLHHAFSKPSMTIAYSQAECRRPPRLSVRAR